MYSFFIVLPLLTSLCIPITKKQIQKVTAINKKIDSTAYPTKFFILTLFVYQLHTYTSELPLPIDLIPVSGILLNFFNSLQAFV